MTESYIKQLTKKVGLYIPLVTTLLIVSGYYDLLRYYSLFQFDVDGKIDPSELFFSFSDSFDDLVVIILYGVPLNAIWRYFTKGKSFELYINYFAYFVIFAFGMMSIAHTMRWIDIFYVPVSSLTILLTFITLYISGINGIEMLKEKFPTINAPWVRLFYAFTCLILFVDIKNQFLVSKLMYGYSEDKTTITHSVQGVPTVTSDSIVYVGSTRNYHYMINRRTFEKFYLPSGEVKSVIIKPLKKPRTDKFWPQSDDNRN